MDYPLGFYAPDATHAALASFTLSTPRMGIHRGNPLNPRAWESDRGPYGIRRDAAQDRALPHRDGINAQDHCDDHSLPFLAVKGLPGCPSLVREGIGQPQEDRSVPSCVAQEWGLPQSPSTRYRRKRPPGARALRCEGHKTPSSVPVGLSQGVLPKEPVPLL